VEQEGLYGLVKQTRFFVRFIVLWSQNGSLQIPQSCQFFNLSLLLSSGMAMNVE